MAWKIYFMLVVFVCRYYHLKYSIFKAWKTKQHVTYHNYYMCTAHLITYLLLLYLNILHII
jgi:hypothetical protein